MGVDSEEFAPSDLDAAMAGEALLAAVAGVDVVARAVVDVAELKLSLSLHQRRCYCCSKRWVLLTRTGPD